MRYLSDRLLSTLDITTEQMVARIEQLVRQQRSGSADRAPKSTLYPGEGRLFMSTLASSEEPPYMAVKSLGMNPANATRGLDTIGAQISLFDGATGLPVAVMDGGWITAVRTAALSGVAAKRLARADCSVMTLVGCGVQARSHLDVFADLFAIERVVAVGRGVENVDALCALAHARGIEASAGTSVNEALARADIVISTVPGGVDHVPFLDAELLKPDTFVSMVDLGRSWLPDSLRLFDEIVIDDLEQERQMKTPMLDLELVRRDLSSLLDDDATAKPSDPAARTAFAFRGVALGDLALAGLCFERAVANGVGQMLEA